MKSKFFNLLLSSLLGSIIYLFIGWVIFDVILGPFTEANTTHLKEFKKTSDFSFLHLYLSCLFYALLINFIFLHSTINRFRNAIAFSAICGILLALMTDLYWYASSNFYTDPMVIVLDAIGAGISVGFLGAFTFYFQKNTVNNN